MATSPAQIRANYKYRKKAYDQLNVRLRKDGGEKEYILSVAEKQGLSLADLIVKSIHYIDENEVKLQ